MQAPIARMRETFHRKAGAEIIICAAGRWSASMIWSFAARVAQGATRGGSGKLKCQSHDNQYAGAGINYMTIGCVRRSRSITASPIAKHLLLGNPTPTQFEDSSAPLPSMLAFDLRKEKWLLVRQPSEGLAAAKESGSSFPKSTDIELLHTAFPTRHCTGARSRLGSPGRCRGLYS
jgi:hypothetical protein